MVSGRLSQRRGTAVEGSITESDGRHDPDGWLFKLEMVDCGRGQTGRCQKCADGPGHGPYWYRYRWSDGKMHKRYVGKNLPHSVSDGSEANVPVENQNHT